MKPDREGLQGNVKVFRQGKPTPRSREGRPLHGLACQPKLPALMGILVILFLNLARGPVRIHTSDGATAIRDGEGEHLLLPSRPVIWIVWGVRGLRYEHELAAGIVFQKPVIDALDVHLVSPKLTQGRCSRPCSSLLSSRYTEGHWDVRARS